MFSSQRRNWYYPLISLSVALGISVGTPQIAYSQSLFELLFRGAQIVQLYNISDEEEVKLGRQINQQLVTQQFQLYRNATVNRYVDRLGQRLAQNSTRPDIPYTFIQHPWFQAARSHKDSQYRDYYVWSENPPKSDPKLLMFPHHHDELTLNYLDRSQQEEIFQAFAPDENMKIFGHGIRRRLAPMLENDRRRLELVYSLLFSLPGTPLLRYGDEIGMGDDLSLEGRTSVRTVMQWSDAPNGDFSNAPQDALVRPIIQKGEYGYKQVNVAAQQRDPASLINWMERAIRIRKQCPEFSCGKWQILETDEPSVFAHCCEWEGKKVIALHNLADKALTVTLKSNEYDRLIDVFGDRHYKTLDENSLSVPLEAYGYRWFRVNQMY